MDTLTEALRAAADDAPTDTGRPDALERAWTGGRRRRVAGRVAGAATVLAVVALVVGIVAGTVGGVPRAVLPADGGRQGVTSYPQRIGHQWFLRTLPSQGVALAGVLRSDAPGSGGWQPVDASGTRYRMPGRVTQDVWPALSADGTRLGYVGTGSGALLRVLDLEAGTHVDYPSVGLLPSGQSGSRSDRYGVGYQTPSFFSRDGLSLAIGAGRGESWNGVLVLGPGGTTAEVPGMTQAAGWLDDDRLLGRYVADPSATTQDPEVRLVVWDRVSGVTKRLGTLALHDPGPDATVSLLGQWWGFVRGDGTLWLLGSDDRETGLDDGSVTTSRWLEGFALPSLTPVDLAGRPLDRPTPVPVADDPPYGQTWAGRRPLRADVVQGDLTVAAGPGAGEAVVANAGEVDVAGSVWAQDALDGGPSWSLFGASSGLLAWWWKEIALAGLALLAWRLAWWRLRLRGAARAGAASRPSPAGP